MQNKALSMLGLATKAGQTVSGEFSVEKAVKAGQAHLVLVAEDASSNSAKQYKDMCSYYNVPMFVCGTKDTLGKACGKENRVCAAVLDERLAAAVSKHLEVQER